MMDGSTLQEVKLNVTPRKAQKEDERMNRPTFIRADGTVDEKSKRKREAPVE